MKIIISNAATIAFESKIDLNRVIPERVDGHALSFKQAEGRVLIDSSVWGIYCKDENTCVLQFEEGVVEFLPLLALTTRIIDKLKREFSHDLAFQVEGLLGHQKSLDKHT